jgi:flagellin FlaB
MLTMNSIRATFLQRLRSLLPNQRGITGLETAIVLIAFVVVSSVFAFAALSTGLFSADKAKDTIQAGLAETRGSMELKGSVVLTATTGTSGTVSKIAFEVANAAGGEAIDLTPGKTIIKYNDDTQSKIFDTAEGFTITAIGDADSDKLLERNEIYQIDLINLNTTDTGANSLTNILSTNTTFSLEIIPPRGAVLFIERTTPVYLDVSTSLD